MMTLQGREEIGSHRGLCRKAGAYPHGVFLELTTPDHGQLMAPPVLLKTQNPNRLDSVTMVLVLNH